MTGHQDIAALIGQRIRARRTSRQWSLDEVATRSGVSRRTLVAIEQGQANPSIAVLSSISDALGIAFASLVGAGDTDAPQGRRAGGGPVLWGGTTAARPTWPGAWAAAMWPSSGNGGCLPGRSTTAHPIRREPANCSRCIRAR
ncbi:helix-turn-helix domain-containing protein [Arthrobacter sp.]|uniref:helix-turn-helix domain-containing protein n=1 Tax=Arthrobacter sp. TaxID=1667 RepID=UPI003A8D9662